MNIVGILIQFRPEAVGAIQPKVVECGCEVHLATEQGKMIATLMHDSDAVVADTLIALQHIDDVLTASMVYHYNDEAYSEENQP